MPGIPRKSILRYLLAAIQASLKAGFAILEEYQQPFSVHHKSDHSPLTQADQKSHDIINSFLKPLNIPVLSEEGDILDDADSKNWHTFWLVDPLDGTKEFIKKNGEFTVNIGLVHDAAPVLGVIFVPARSLLYFAAAAMGAYRVDTRTISEMEALENKNLDFWLQMSTPIHVNRDNNRPYTLVVSRSHGSPALDSYIQSRQQIFQRMDFMSAGSSLKFCLVAEGKADEYPRLGPTMEWDTAAGQIIAEQGGGKVVSYETGLPLTYHKPGFRNPWFVVSNGRHEVQKEVS